jgi:hypothetical protein
MVQSGPNFIKESSREFEQEMVVQLMSNGDLDEFEMMKK